MNSASADAKKKVLSALSSGELPIRSLAERLRMSASTVSKYCLVLEAEKRIEIRKFGNMKLVRRK